MVEVDDLSSELAGIVADIADGVEADGDRSAAVPAPAVIGVDLPDLERHPRLESGRCRPLSPWRAKGLEFDSVIVVEPARLLDEPGGLSLLYVALTRSTDRLTIVHQRPLPGVLAAAIDGASASDGPVDHR